MENLRKFFRALQTDKELKEKLEEVRKAYEGKEMSDEQRRDIIEREELPIIKAAGYDVSAADVEAFLKVTHTFTQEEVLAAKSAEALIAMGKEEDIEISAEQAAALLSMVTGELSDDELEAAAGGSWWKTCPNGHFEIWFKGTGDCTKCTHYKYLGNGKNYCGYFDCSTLGGGGDGVSDIRW